MSSLHRPKVQSIPETGHHHNCLSGEENMSKSNLHALYTTCIENLDALSGQKIGQPVDCSCCELKSDEEPKCKDCSEASCPPCRTGTRSSTRACSDSAVPQKDRKGLPHERGSCCVSVPCLDHPGSIYKYVCETCIIPACPECVHGHHSDNTCTVHPLENTLSMRENNLQESTINMDRILSSLSSSIACLDQTKSFLVKKRDQEIQQLHQKAKSLVEQILSEETKCAKKLDDLYKFQIDSVDVESKGIRDNQCAVINLKRLSEEVLENGNSVQVNVLSKALTGCKKELQSFKSIPHSKETKTFTVQCNFLEKESVFLISEMIMSSTDSMCSNDSNGEIMQQDTHMHDDDVARYSDVSSEETMDSSCDEEVRLTASITFIGGLGKAYQKQKHGISLKENGSIEYCESPNEDSSCELCPEMDIKTIANVPTWPLHDYIMARSTRQDLRFDHRVGPYSPSNDGAIATQPYENITHPSFCPPYAVTFSLTPQQTICISNGKNQGRTDVSAMVVGGNQMLLVDRGSKTVKQIDQSLRAKSTLFIDELSTHPLHSLAFLNSYIVFVCGTHACVSDENLTLLRSFQLVQDQYQGQGETYLPLCKFSDTSFVVGNLPGPLLRIYDILGQLEVEVVSPVRGATVAIVQNRYGNLLFSSWEDGGFVLEVQKNFQIIRTYKPYGIPLWHPEDMSVDNTGRVFITDPVLNHIHGFNSVGIPLFVYSTTNDGLMFPRCICAVEGDSCVVTGQNGKITLYKLIYLR
ncbi:E3 ubiquitin-protein ligase TRIM56-like [Haliotis asinina]|uniref:E3 ubiquitin-protein ligase TRIM56-like n=1 Tax=Haliotis asinina TaxID=109174 RepID=UPI003531DB9F